MNKAEKSLRWVVNQIPDFKPTTNEEKMLVVIKLNSEAGAEEIKRLESENAALRKRLDKAVELKVKVGDTIYMPWIWNGNSGIAGLIVREIQTVGDGVTYYITSFTTDDLSFAAHYKFGKFEEYYFGNMVFTTPEAATVRLKELKGEAK